MYSESTSSSETTTTVTTTDISTSTTSISVVEQGLEKSALKRRSVKDDSGDGTSSSLEDRFESETVLSCFWESIVPLTLAGCGQVSTGLYLDYVNDCQFFLRIPQAIALITPLLNLKGNLEMNYASRIATYCHTGLVRTNKELMHLGCINHGLSQSQSISASFIIAILCILINYGITFNNSVIFVASAITTASLASFSIETFLLLVIIVARLLHVNPDNVATPIAATVGDISTLFFYVCLGSIFVKLCPIKFCYWSLSAIIVSLALIPFYVRLASSHPSTKRALIAGWIPLIVASVISGGGGYILHHVHDIYDGYSLLQPLIVGLIGNMCGIQSSRISSQLHVYHRKKELARKAYPRRTFLATLNPVATFFRDGIHSKVAIMMIAVALPTQLIFAVAVLFIGGRSYLVGFAFCSLYALCVLFLITLFMYLCQVFVHLLWRSGHDPDYSVIPLLTALCDFVGSFLLFGVFWLMKRIDVSLFSHQLTTVSTNFTTSPTTSF
ncbi:divalent cation transporter domain-containing protein [Ditylenchus destructor]|nr:divalent cation transporter domain-containing protein [Ditylenchus destructor]